MKLLHAVIFASLLGTVMAHDAHACSPRHINTPQELVQLADGIYLVKAVRYSSGAPPRPLRPIPPPSSQLTFQVLAVLKGPQKTAIQAPGTLSLQNDPNDRPVPYDFVRPDGRGGNCFALDHKIGQEYLLFLKDQTPYWSPLAPTNEQVKGATDPWVLWVMQHIRSSVPQPNNSFKPKPLRGSA